MSQFLLPTLGGALIAFSAVLMMAMLGRIAGISGIFGGLLPPAPATGGEAALRLAFVVGLLGGPLLLGLLTGDTGIGAPTVDLPMMIVGGFLVGIGTALGSGCTSGHGICGLSRLSPRSLVAVATFMATGVATVFVVRHLF
ncbi:YeeE/YedE family protein [Zavarzinia compransoris]|uniref:YeeE/YedE family protein n=1 Tax=Zavarzinia marina TaxID=2911065 RepID=UPI001F3F53B9|nr:YeeE/YedE thiosulfate transporter family protein [Zavarzinia marina]MCF4165890.1 YeeE/YedE family protein [Zavarzinia marina]